MPKETLKDQYTFQGFSTPNTTPVPDELFDELAPRLSEAELRVLLYIVRRTFGFKKNSDFISLNQMINGITTREGKVLDQGTGMSRQGVMRGLKGLLEKGAITVRKSISEDGVNQINLYSLRFRSEGRGVVYKVDHGSLQSRPGVVSHVDSQETVLQETDEQETEGSRLKKSQISTESNLKGGLGGETSLQPELPEPQSRREIRGAGNRSQSPSTLTANGASANISLALAESPSSAPDIRPAEQETRETGSDMGESGLTPIGHLVAQRVSAAKTNGSQTNPEARRGPSKSAAVLEDLATPASRKSAQERPRTPEKKSRRGKGRAAYISTPYLDRVIEEFSLMDLRDPDHTSSNQHQARNLMQDAGIEEEYFVQNYVYPARSQTRAQSNVERRGAYFFACLRDLLGMRVDEAGPIPPIGRATS